MSKYGSELAIEYETLFKNETSFAYGDKRFILYGCAYIYNFISGGYIYIMLTCRLREMSINKVEDEMSVLESYNYAHGVMRTYVRRGGGGYLMY
ncbi:hypothetical protein JOD02_001760 [Caldicoprobacter guelmensis]|nr:hypothetical protein [Caldicoprobacter guelmensis]